jgi:hypothetical protein
MKFFTRELWAGFNTEDDAAFRRNDASWNRNLAAYRRHLEKLKPRLSKQIYRFVTKESLHDGRLISFNVSDNLDFDIDEEKRFDRNSRKTGVSMKVLNYEQDALFLMRYTKVKRVLFDYPTDNPLFEQEKDFIGDWGYDEFSEVDGDYLRHEVLFSSGTTILIKFKHFTYKRIRIRK